MKQSNYEASLPKSSFNLKKYLGILFLFILLACGIYVYFKYYFTYSNGNRFGLLQKFSRRGNVFKTYEGEMILNLVRSNATVPLASEKFYFSVTKKNVADQLMNIQGRNITIRYKEKHGTLPWRGDTKYIVDSVQVENLIFSK